MGGSRNRVIYRESPLPGLPAHCRCSAAFAHITLVFSHFPNASFSSQPLTVPSTWGTPSLNLRLLNSYTSFHTQFKCHPLH